MEIPLFNISGEEIKKINISDSVFAVPFNEAVVHQVMVQQRANSRQGTSSTKTRSEVAGTSKKLFRQKHTGEARAGSRRSPLRYKGGITFGPKPRSYRQEIPKKMRRLALKCVLSAKAGEGELKVLDDLIMDEPKTRNMIIVMQALGIGASSLIVTADPQENLIKSARNIPDAKTLPCNLLNVIDLLSYKNLLMTEAAVRKVEELWGNAKGGTDASI